MTTTSRRAPKRPPITPPAASDRDEIFEFVSGLGTLHGTEIILGGDAKLLPGTLSMKRVADRLSLLFGIRKVETAQLMGVSESTVSRRTKPSTDVLDRALTASTIYADVAAVLGPQDARVWFGQPNPALDGRRPIELLRTRTGEKQLEGVITALLNGAFL